MREYITDNIEISSDSDKENSIKKKFWQRKLSIECVYFYI